MESSDIIASFGQKIVIESVTFIGDYPFTNNRQGFRQNKLFHGKTDQLRDYGYYVCKGCPCCTSIGGVIHRRDSSEVPVC